VNCWNSPLGLNRMPGNSIKKMVGAILQSQLNEHIGKQPYKFPKRFSRPELRQAIKVQP